MKDREKKIDEIDTILRSIFGSQFAYKINFAKYGGYDYHEVITTSTIARELTDKGYRKERTGMWRCQSLPRTSCHIDYKITCTRCGYKVEILRGQRYRFCPNCGAKMFGEGIEYDT